MPANGVVRARIDEKTKKQAARVFKSMGLTTRTVAEKRLPFELLPNAETIEAIEELRCGGGKTFKSVEDLMTDLKANG